MNKSLLIRIIILILVISFFNSSFSQPTNLSFKQKTKIKIKLNKGNKRIFENNYREALNIFREVLSIDGDNPKANYKVGECQYYLGKYKNAMKYIQKGYKLDKEVNDEIHYLLGATFHRLAKVDSAKKHYLTFDKKASNKTKEMYNLENLIKQCDFAKKLMSNPLKVTVENMGRKINTLSPEYSASITEDGKTIVFTSRRADTKGGLTDLESDNLYYEDIYISHFNDTTMEWSNAKPIEGKANTEFHDAVLNISPDGSYILVYKNDPSETKSGDIYISKKNEETKKFGTPKPIDKGRNVNSSYFESSASTTSDGNTIFFVSDRTKGMGAADIYYATKIGANRWSEPVNLGDSINTELDEKCVFIHPNGKILFFTSQGHENMGGYDIFVSYRTNGIWSKAKNLGFPINTVKEEKTFSITKDGKTAYISAEYEDSKGNSDIYKVDLSNLNILKP